MPRPPLIHAGSLPYHITARTNKGEVFPSELSYIWKVFTSELYLLTLLHELRIHAFLLMPNHIHLMVTTPEITISKLMQKWLSSTTRIINTKNHQSGRIFGARYHWSLITESLYYGHALKYVYRNPVKAGLCERVEDYPFSSFAGLSGKVKLPMAIRPPFHELDRLVPKDFNAMETWLNEAHPQKENGAIQKALRKKIFKIPVNRKKRKAASVLDAASLPKVSDTI